MVTVMHGADFEERDDLAKRTVAEVRALYEQLFNISPDAVPLLNGRQVEEDAVLKDGNKLEFTKKAIKAAERAGVSPARREVLASTPTAGWGAAERRPGR